MRVNGRSNYEYPRQRWVPKLVYYILLYYNLSTCLLSICLVCLSVYHSTCLLIICLSVYLYCLIMYRKQVYSPRTRLITRIRLIIRDQIGIMLKCAQAHNIKKIINWLLDEKSDVVDMIILIYILKIIILKALVIFKAQKSI